MRETQLLGLPMHRIRPLAASLAIALAFDASATTVLNVDGKGPRDLFGSLPGLERAAIESPSSRLNSLQVGVQASPKVPVTTCDETSLRNAIAGAMDGDTIDLTALTACQITLTTGSILVNVDNLALNGPGADQLTIDGGYYNYSYNRVFTHTGGGTFSISGMSIGDADYRGSNAKGGCIYSAGSVAVFASALTGCMVEAASGSGSYSLGGAIYSRGSTSLSFSTVLASNAYSSENGAYGGGVFARGNFQGKYSTIRHNQARTSQPFYSHAGGIAVFGDGNIDIRYSTLADNWADVDGAIESSTTGTAHIVDSTISGNSANFYVGGAAFLSSVTIANTTVAYNLDGNSYYGAGVYVAPGATLTAQSSIFSSNGNVGDDGELDVFADVIDGSDSLIRTASSAVPGNTVTACPRLLPLQDNGGPTLTHALNFGSLAIDAGNTTFMTLLNDQRFTGFTRTFGAGTDIGAFEWQGDVGDEIFKSAFESRCDVYP